ncbi:uncharacterized protein RCO7_05870 [Rhynchosporium graminicola]|uniref:DUF7732 domain-containing protein n=1 Tax=Rhynchosporium graminicola TaxID=2792576 RepID=A0A1E1KAN8_9HELO|nr:uncharacterized protein RCO7_05870 [Rhynchosporium commune]
MRFLETVAVCLLATNTPVLAHPQPVAEIAAEGREALREVDELFAPVSDLYKRKGGGGGGGKGGGGGSSGGSSGKGGSSSSSGSGGTSGASGSGGRGSGSSNVGGSTRTGSGVTPRFGGKYGGGASTPYKAGGVSPRGIAPVFLGVAALSILPGLWLYGAYGYGYHNPYSFRNRTARRNGTNTTDTPTRDYVQLITRLVSRQEDAGVSETKPVTCLCAEYAVCGCDDDGNYTFLDSIIGDGDYFKLNTSLVNVANDANGTSTIYLNGTLPNGTTAAGGTEEADGSSTNANGSTNAAVRTLVEASGYWVMVAAVGLTCFAI